LKEAATAAAAGSIAGIGYSRREQAGLTYYLETTNILLLLLLLLLLSVLEEEKICWTHFSRASKVQQMQLNASI
jgi:hypothetical protein